MKTGFSLSVLFITMLLAGCNPYYYKANGLNVPLFTDKGQYHISVQTGGVSEMQASVSPINNLGIIANYSTHTVKINDNDWSAHIFEVGGGYYHVLKEDKSNVVVDVYGGGGTGSINSDVNMNITRFFIQPGIGIRTDYFDVAANFRFSDVFYSNFDANSNDNTYLYDHNLIDKNGKRIDQGSYLFAEPAITVRGGYKFIKAQMQFVLCDGISHIPWNYDNNTFTFGLYFNIEDALNLGKNNDTKTKK